MKISAKKIPVVILCGGKGTRMGALSELLPKPMQKIGNYPMIWHIMKLYHRFQFEHFVLALGYKGWEIKNYFLNYQAIHLDLTLDLATSKTTFHKKKRLEPWKISMIDTGEDSLTATRIRLLKSHVEATKAPIFCVTYGDGIGNVNLSDLISFHHSHGKIATVTGVHPPSRFGELTLDGTTVVEFNEKPQAEGSYINGGFFVFDAKKIWDYLPVDSDVPLEKLPLQHLAKDLQLMMFRHDGFWQPMDTPREHQLLNELWNSGSCPWDL